MYAQSKRTYTLPLAVGNINGPRAREAHHKLLSSLLRQTDGLKTFGSGNRKLADKINSILNEALYYSEEVRVTWLPTGSNLDNVYTPGISECIKLPLDGLRNLSQDDAPRLIVLGKHTATTGNVRANRKYTMFLVGITHTHSIPFKFSTHIHRGQVLFGNTHAETTDSRLIALSTVDPTLIPSTLHEIMDFVVPKRSPPTFDDFYDDVIEFSASEAPNCDPPLRKHAKIGDNEPPFIDTDDRLTKSTSLESTLHSNASTKLSLMSPVTERHGSVSRSVSPSALSSSSTLSSVCSSMSSSSASWSPNLSRSSGSFSFGHSSLVHKYLMPANPPLRNSVDMKVVSGLISSWVMAIYMATHMEIDRYDTYIEKTTREGSETPEAWEAARWIICIAMASDDALAEIFAEAEVAIAVRAYARCANLDQKLAMLRANEMDITTAGGFMQSDIELFRDHATARTRGCLAMASRVWDTIEPMHPALMKHVNLVIEYMLQHVAVNTI
jgi:hypothetical protein